MLPLVEVPGAGSVATYVLGAIFAVAIAAHFHVARLPRLGPGALLLPGVLCALLLPAWWLPELRRQSLLLAAPLLAWVLPGARRAGAPDLRLAVGTVLLLVAGLRLFACLPAGCCHGVAATWGLTYAAGTPAALAFAGAPTVPTQLLEAGWAAAAFAVVARHPRLPLALALAGLLRIPVLALRVDAAWVEHVSVFALLALAAARPAAARLDFRRATP